MTETIFRIKCKGRDRDRNEVLDKAVDVEVKVYQPNACTITSEVKCKHYFKQDNPPGCECSASGRRGVVCAYELNMPSVQDDLIKTIKELER